MKLGLMPVLLAATAVGVVALAGCATMDSSPRR